MARTTSNINPLWREIRQRTSDSNLIYSDVHTAPFSFGKYIFIPSNISEKELELILRHESVHTRELHYIDIWLSKIVCIIQFFNPLAWIYAKAIQDNCEFIADHRTLQSTERKEDYLQLLIKYSIQPHFNTATLNFAFPLIIKRLKIIKQKQSSKYSSLKGLAIIPLACAIMVGYAQTRTIVNQPDTQKQATASTATGHPAKGQKAETTVLPQPELLAQNTTTQASATQSKKESSMDDLVVVGYGKAKNADKPKSSPLTDDVFMVTEEPPKFGEGDISAYLKQNIRYPADAMERDVSGRVICQFIVEKDGSITSVSVVRSVDPFLDAEACRVIYGMPKWIPGKQRGEKVRVKYTLPINFHLE
jgi:TonB family protein